jgi:hypothetical protein
MYNNFLNRTNMKTLFIFMILTIFTSCELQKFDRPVAENDEEQATEMDNETQDVENPENEFPDEEIPDNGIAEIEGVVCTGQTQCYNEYPLTACPSENHDYFGTDGYYSTKGICLERDFVLAGSEPEQTVIDNNTGLEWIRVVPDDKFDWAGAVKYCRDSEYAGFDDWRLPDYKELRTLVYYGKDVSPAIEDDLFPSTPENFFWTSSVDVMESIYGWYVDFSYGISGRLEKKGLNHVRCVRGKFLPENSFIKKTVKDDEVISDESTKLIWSVPEFYPKSWKYALVYCRDLNYGGSSSWRVPNINELLSLVDISERKPASLFPDLPFEKFWSSTTDSSYYSQFAVAVNFENGEVSGEVKTDDNFVICVTGEDQEQDGKCVSDNGCPEGEICIIDTCYGNQNTKCDTENPCPERYNCINKTCYLQNAFVSTWNDDGTGITLPLVSSGSYYFAALWGDGAVSRIDRWNDPDTTHKYKTPGSYTVQIIGFLTGWQFCDGSQIENMCESSNSLKITEINQWGNMSLGSTSFQFGGCSNLDITAKDTPDLSKTMYLTGTFAGCSSLVGNESFNNWDVSSIRHMDLTFFKAENFNQDISKWNVSYVYNMNAMLANAVSFDQDLSLWSVSNALDMGNMFKGVTLSTANYDAILNGWSELMLQNDVNFHGGNSKYSLAAEAARAKIISDFNWTITDGGKE